MKKNNLTNLVEETEEQKNQGGTQTVGNQAVLMISKSHLIIIAVAVVAILILAIGMSIHEKNALNDLKNKLGIVDDTVVEISDDAQLTATTLREVIAPASDLISYKYYYTDAGEYEKDKKFFNTKIAVPFTKNQQVYVCSGTIGVGIDISDVDFDIDKVAKRIIITMPAIKVMYHEMDTDNFQSYDVKSSVFTKIDLKDYADFQEELQAKQEEKLASNDVFWLDAKNNAEDTIRGLLTAAGIADKYDIQFVWQE